MKPYSPLQLAVEPGLTLRLFSCNASGMEQSPFDYLKMKDEFKYTSDMAKAKALELYALIKDTPASREQALAVTKLEECLMWFNKHLSRL